MRYRGFISYSHADKRVAAQVHRWLEAYRVPRRLVGRETAVGPVPARLHPIFRDREELPTSADLGSQIQAALAESATLVIICSPRAAASRWVNEEILAYKRLGRTDRILCLIIDGEPNATDKLGREAEECFPPALRFHLDSDGAISGVPAEPIAADMRTVGDGRRDAFLKLAAGITGVGFDELRQRELQRQVRRAITVSVVSLGLLASMAGLAFAAFVARLEAVRQQAIAVRERDRAEENFREARDAVDRFYTKVSEEDLLKAEGLQPLRRDLLEQALGYYERFLQQRGDDPDFAFDAAVVTSHVASILAEVGDPVAALAHAERAAHVFEAMHEAAPLDERVTERLAESLASRAVLLDRLGRSTDALDAHVRAINLHQSRSPGATNPTDLDLSRLWSVRGALEARLGRLEDAVLSYEQSLTVAAARGPMELAPLGFALDSGALGVIVIGVTPYSPVADAGIRVGDVLESIAGVKLPSLDNWEQVRDRLKPNVGSPFTVIRAGKRLDITVTPVHLGDFVTATTKLNLGYLLLHRQGQPERARPWLEQSVDEYRRTLLRQSAANPEVRQGLASAAGELGTCGMQLGDMKLFERGLREAARVAEDNVRENPAVPAFRSMAGIGLTNLSSLFWRQGQLDEAAAACETAITHFRLAIETGGDRPTDRLHLLQALTNLALLTADRQGPEAALPIYEAATEATRAITDAEGSHVPVAIARLYRNHAAALRKAHRLEAAVQQYEAAAAGYAAATAALAAEAPMEAVAPLRVEAAQMTPWIAAVHVRCGDEEAAALAEHLFDEQCRLLGAATDDQTVAVRLRADAAKAWSDSAAETLASDDSAVARMLTTAKSQLQLAERLATGHEHLAEIVAAARRSIEEIERQAEAPSTD